MGSYDKPLTDSPYRRALARIILLEAALERKTEELARETEQLTRENEALETEVAGLQWKLGERGLV